jgi:hypothetical protein
MTARKPAARRSRNGAETVIEKTGIQVRLGGYKASIHVDRGLGPAICVYRVS